MYSRLVTGRRLSAAQLDRLVDLVFTESKTPAR